MENKYYAFYEYIGENKLFTVSMLPDKAGKFPIVIKRSPYVSDTDNLDEKATLVKYMADNEKWLRNGYAVIMQHCRGKGKSGGDCVPFINEREDSLHLYDYARKSDFYNGELFLWGGSYCCEVHYLASPYPDDIKGAVMRVKNTERYDFSYRNGCFKINLLGNWYVTEMFNKEGYNEFNYTPESFNILPLLDFSKTVYGKNVPEFDNILKHPDPKDEYWNSIEGGVEIRDAIKNVKFPVLLEASLYDIFEGGVFRTWKGLSEETRNNSAFLVSAYNHHDEEKSSPIKFPEGERKQKFGNEYDVAWFNAIRGKNPCPFEKGKVTYYNLFLNEWKTDDFEDGENSMKLKLGEGEKTYTYNPYNAPEFPGGLSSNFGDVTFQNKPNERYDVISLYTAPFEKDVIVKGKMKAELKVASDCPDTCFFMRISIEKHDGDFGLRDDITTLCYQLGDYKENSKVTLDFEFDEHAFLVRRNERLRIDISSADNNNYVRHTNNKGLYSEQTTARIAHNTVYLNESYIEIPYNNY